jgi:purine-cytosine permease-like protein
MLTSFGNAANRASGSPHAAKDAVIPASERRGPVTMALLWITMITCFPTVLIGFEWFKQGIVLSQVIVCTLLSCVVMLAYTVPIAHLAAKTGKSYGQLNEFLFGKQTGSAINVLLILIFIGFYGLTALLLADAIGSLFHLNIPNWAMAGVFALIMALNNFFGFKGVANFARFLAAPVIICWVLYTFMKAAPACPATVWTEAGSQSFICALGTISSFVVGFAAWGNEADYWRYGKPRVGYAIWPLAIALAIGQVIFPITGWMVARIFSITDFSAATAFMNNYSFGGIAIAGAIAFFASYFASNDSNLFGSATALDALAGMRHRNAIALLAVLGAIMALALSLLGAAKAVESIVSLNSVILPVATLLVITEWLLSTRGGKAAFSRGGNSKAAVIALCAGMTVGVATSGVLPGLAFMHIGIPWLQAWLLTLAIYVPMRLQEYRNESLSVTIHLTDLEPAEAAWLVAYGDRYRDMG